MKKIIIPILLLLSCQIGKQATLVPTPERLAAQGVASIDTMNYIMNRLTQDSVFINDVYNNIADKIGSYSFNMLYDIVTNYIAKTDSTLITSINDISVLKNKPVIGNTDLALLELKLGKLIKDTAAIQNLRTLAFFQSKADTGVISGLKNQVNISVNGLQTSVNGLQTMVNSKADKASLAGKADIALLTALSAKMISSDSTITSRLDSTKTFLIDTSATSAYILVWDATKKTWTVVSRTQIK